MDDPVRDITAIVHKLTQSKPSVQRDTIEKYFTSDASFTHPFCRTGSFEGSRFLIRAIFRWYKILSPRIDLKVNSVAYDDNTLTLYVNISQIFRIFFIPFHASPVTLTTVLKLRMANGKYYISSQEDLYQVDQFARFAPIPFPLVGALFVFVWHFIASFFCLIAAAAFWPISVAEEYYGRPQAGRRMVEDGSLRVREVLDQAGRRLAEVRTAPAIEKR